MKKVPKSKYIIEMSGFFLQNRRNPETEIFAFCVILFEPIDPLSTSK